MRGIPYILAAIAAVIQVFPNNLIHARVINFRTDIGGIPGDPKMVTMQFNSHMLSQALNKTNNLVQDGDVLLFPAGYFFYFMGGVESNNVPDNLTIQINGILSFGFANGIWNQVWWWRVIREWPRYGAHGVKSGVLQNTISTQKTSTVTETTSEKTSDTTVVNSIFSWLKYFWAEIKKIPSWRPFPSEPVKECINLRNAKNLTITSDTFQFSHEHAHISDEKLKNLETMTGGIIDGNGESWYGFIGYLLWTENRPRLLAIHDVEKLTVKNIFLKDSPYWTFLISNTNDITIEKVRIEARRKAEYENKEKHMKHDMYSLSAFNTDGIDLADCNNVHVKNSYVWNQDDGIAMKGSTSDCVFEDLTVSGLGLAVGSVGDGSVLRNATWKNINMPNTDKGIYLKMQQIGGNSSHGAIVSNMTFENITITDPSGWAVWIGPAQQSDSRSLCAAHPCSICWPLLEDLGAKCDASERGQYSDILLKNVTTIFTNISNANDGIRTPHLVGNIMGGSKAPIRGLVFDDVVTKGTVNPIWNCEGVADAEAVGKTWPVPSCFPTNDTGGNADSTRDVPDEEAEQVFM